MMRRLDIIATVVCGVTLFAAGCGQQPASTPDTRAADEAAIRAADIAWSQVAAAGNVDAHLAYFVDDGVVLSPNEAILEGKAAIRKMTSEMFATPGFSLKWQPTRVEVARSGDLGYSIGTYQLAMNGPKGAPMTDQGKYTTIWKKQADGSWKVAADMFNSDLPAPGPPAK